MRQLVSSLIPARVRVLFLIDAGGALLSALLLGVILPQWQPAFGIPREVLYFLAVWPCLFAAYDLLIWWRRRPVRAIHLQLIAGANLGYCLLSAGLLLFHAASLTLLGWLYFGGEIAIVLGLAGVELWVAAQLRPAG